MNTKKQHLLRKTLSLLFVLTTVWYLFSGLLEMPTAFCVGTVAVIIASYFSNILVSATQKHKVRMAMGVMWAVLWLAWLCYQLLSLPDVTLVQFVATAALVLATIFTVVGVGWLVARAIKIGRQLRALIALAIMSTVAVSVQAAAKVDRIEPTNWYVGMKNPSLQLMIYGKNVREARVAVDYPGAKVDSLVRLDSPNYLLVYLNIADAKAGEMVLKIDGRKVKYQLKAREKRGEERIGFSNADVLYQLMPDRFASGRSDNDQIGGMHPYRCDRSNPNLRHGGDLEGIRQHLDYFNQLGITALWFTPVLENDSPDRDGFSTYHGYAPTNYYRIDPRFGSNEDYRRLTDEAHAHGLKMVMDMIFNHCGFEHPWVSDVPSHDWFNLHPSAKGKKDNYRPSLGEGEGTTFTQTSYQLTPVRDKYASEIDLHETLEGWFVPTMPDLNQHNPHVLRYLIQNSMWWIESMGIDGIRMDTYPYAFGDAMSLWMQAVNDEYPTYNVVGETWVTEPAYTASWQKDNRLSKENSHLPTVMDFALYDRMVQAFGENTGDYGKGLNRVYNSLVYDYLYPNPSSVLAFIENHDTDRYLQNTTDTLALKQALALLLTIDRIPQLYYGVEILLNGTKEHSDGDVRQDFPGGFCGDRRNAFTAEGRTQAENSMFDWLSRLLHWRQGNDIITRGTMKQFIPHRGIYVVARQLDGKTVMTILNGTPHPATMPIARYVELIGNHTQARNVVNGNSIAIDRDISLQPRETLIIEF